MATSLRRYLLALLLPVVVVATIGGILAVYFIAYRASAGALDDGLRDAVQIYVEQLRARPDEGMPDLSASAQRVLLATPEDRIFFSLQAIDGRLLAGERPLADDLPWGSLQAPAFFDLNHGGYWLRGISVVFDVGGGVRHLILATTAHKREELMGDIMLGMVMPQIALFLLTIALVWGGVRQGLSPLEGLQAEISRRSQCDLSTLDPMLAPEEMRPLVAEINALLVRLDQAIESQRNFIADAAHQLRTPIAGLLAQIEAGGPAVADNPALLLTARRLARLVGQLLTLSRAEPGMDPEEECFDLAALIRAEANSWLPHAFQRGIDVRFDLAETRLHGSPHAYGEMLANLIDNAMRYGRPGGCIAVSCGSENGEAVLRVDDDGSGIPQADRQRVFERFYRGRDAGPDGCGLGLPIVRALARQQGAQVELGDSPELGGLRVEIRVPKKAVPE